MLWLAMLCVYDSPSLCVWGVLYALDQIWAQDKEQDERRKAVESGAMAVWVCGWREKMQKTRWNGGMTE